MSGWEEQRMHAAVLEEHDHICHICGKPGADVVDDVIPLSEGGAPTEANKRPAHQEPCHRVKTQAEAARAHKTAKRPKAKHPGRMT